MPAAKLLSTVVITGLLAFASGFIVEDGKSAVSKISEGLEDPGMAQASVAPEVPNLPRPPIQTLMATPLPTSAGWSRAQPAAMDLAALDHGRYSLGQSAACPAELRARPSGDGMMEVALDVPCSPNEAVTLRHSGLDFTVKTSDKGHLDVTMPALTTDAHIEAVLAGGRRVHTETRVPDASLYDRVALVWRGEGGLHVHAQEFGSDPSGAGHVWAGAPGRDDLGPNATTGYMKVYGDRSIPSSTRAEVYTFPAEAHVNSGVIRLYVEADVTNTNCGALVAARTLQPNGTGGVNASDITLTLPECDKIGQQLVLNNVLRDLKIASNN